MLGLAACSVRSFPGLCADDAGSTPDAGERADAPAAEPTRETDGSLADAPLDAFDAKDADDASASDAGRNDGDAIGDVSDSADAVTIGERRIACYDTTLSSKVDCALPTLSCCSRLTFGGVEWACRSSGSCGAGSAFVCNADADCEAGNVCCALQGVGNDWLGSRCASSCGLTEVELCVSDDGCRAGKCKSLPTTTPFPVNGCR